jgi:hypothetical protein
MIRRGSKGADADGPDSCAGASIGSGSVRSVANPTHSESPMIGVIFLVLHKGRKAPLHFSTDLRRHVAFLLRLHGVRKEVQTLATVSFQSCKIVHQETKNVTSIFFDRTYGNRRQGLPEVVAGRGQSTIETPPSVRVIT